MQGNSLGTERTPLGLVRRPGRRVGPQLKPEGNQSILRPAEPWPGRGRSSFSFPSRPSFVPKSVSTTLAWSDVPVSPSPDTKASWLATGVENKVRLSMPVSGHSGEPAGETPVPAPCRQTTPCRSSNCEVPLPVSNLSLSSPSPPPYTGRGGGAWKSMRICYPALAPNDGAHSSPGSCVQLPSPNWKLASKAGHVHRR